MRLRDSYWAGLALLNLVNRAAHPDIFLEGLKPQKIILLVHAPVDEVLAL